MIIASRVAGRFNLRVICKHSKKLIRQTGWFSNLILDQGLDAMGTSSSWIGHCHVGIGHSMPAVDQVELDQYVATNSFSQVANSGAAPNAPWYVFTQHRYEFAFEGLASEIGVGWSANPTHLFARALIKDENGAPTTIAILADETLEVLYELRIHPPAIDVTGDGWTTRAYRVNAFSDTREGWNISAGAADYRLSGIHNTQNMVGLTTPASYSNSIVGTAQTYIPGSHERLIEFAFGLSDGNLSGGIKFMVVKLGWGAYQIGFDPSIAKTSDKKFDITFKHSWARRT